ncbi:glycosyltransferase [Roseovarius sp. MMSF_3281]|uniref:glycosyltransferase n=1 Tax=Roseovarius sp. MMSF_3281 TaxID=3046694 RepID=UPI00273EF0AE|nr:glycosyltransferase [Roseovarius sp. MMSF_3281]
MAEKSLHIRILLATRNGAGYLPAQLQSFADQNHSDWSLDVGDDGSTDATADLVAEFANRHPGRDVRFLNGPRAGSASNFLTLLQGAVKDNPDAAIAFSDQDDVWLPQKLERAAAWMSSQGADRDIPLVWVSRTILTDADLRPMGKSRSFPRPGRFGNALVQNILAGNTIVLSSAAARVVARTTQSAIKAGVPYHDWWIYQVTTGMGAIIRQEPEPLVLYRQHRGNLLGHHGPVRGRLRRLGLIARRNYSDWITANTTALSEHPDLLTRENRRLLEGFMAARNQGGRTLAAALPSLGVYRQTPMSDRLLLIMARSGRL